MSKPNHFLQVDTSKRHFSYHIDEQGFQSQRSQQRTSPLTSDLLRGFPLPPSQTIQRNSTLSSLEPIINSPFLTSNSNRSTNNSFDSSVDFTPPRPLPSLPNSLLSPALSSHPFLDHQIQSQPQPRRKSSIVEQELLSNFHPSFSPTSSMSDHSTSSYFPSSSYHPTLPPLLPFNSRVDPRPLTPSTPPPSASLPTLPSFVSVFIDPNSSSFILSSPPRTPQASPSIPKDSVSPVSNKSQGSTLEIRNPRINSPRAVELQEELTNSASGSKRRRKNASLASKWSFGNGFSNSNSVQNSREEWTTLETELRKDDQAISRVVERSAPTEAKVTRQVNGSNFNNEEWLQQKYDFTPVKKSKEVSNGRKIFTKTRILIILVVGIIILIGIVISVYLNKTKPGSSIVGTCVCENGGEAKPTDEGICLCECKSIFAGDYCQYNSTCVTIGNNTVAQAFLDVATVANTFFSPSINSTRLALVVNKYLHIPISNNQCLEQLSILSLPSLPPSQFARRSAWSTSAVLWSLINTETSSTSLTTFINSLNFTQFQDFPSPTPNINYQIQHFGYIFDFANLELSVPAISWLTKSSPDKSQSTQIMTPTSIQSEVLDNIYSHALAASTQRNLSLIHLWSELGLSSNDLQNFIAAVKSAPVVIPLDPTLSIGGIEIMNLGLQQVNDVSFPPAISCLSGLSRSQISSINSVETVAFGLSTVSSSNPIDSACLDRPLYGFINLLSLRTPFIDSDPRSLPTQGLVLQEFTKSRMTIHAGELLLGASSGVSTSSPSQTSFPDHFASYQDIESVLFEYLNLLTPTVANNLVNFVLSQSTTNSLPPTINSQLYLNSNKLLSIPILEISLFGGLQYSDIDHSISSLTISSPLNDSNSIFFGTATAQLFRTWALNGPKLSSGSILQSPIRWSRGAFEVNPVVEGSLENVAFEGVWNGSSNLTEGEIWQELSLIGTLKVD